jgi:hypothetical protein
MPFESVACPSCGSDDVQEVKPNTYFCNQHEGVFKHLDPSRVTTTPAFCGCGNRVEFQCQICRATGLCALCDQANPSRTDGQLLYVLWRDHGDIGHLCGQCKADALPELTALQTADFFCKFCGSPEAERKCRCCGAGLCVMHCPDEGLEIYSVLIPGLTVTEPDGWHCRDWSIPIKVP